MNQYPAQTDLAQMENGAMEIPGSIPSGASPFKKLILIGILATIALILLLFSLLSVSSKSAQKTQGSPTPTQRPTATPVYLPSATPEAVVAVSSPLVTTSAGVTPVKAQIGRLAFIKEGDIYQSDGQSFGLLFKNSIPAGDKLSWSPDGKMLAWRPKSETATPSVLTVLNREKKQTFAIIPAKSVTEEVIDYDWSWDSSNIYILYKDGQFNISSFSSSTGSASEAIPAIKPIYSKNLVSKQIITVDADDLMVTNSEGINLINIKTQESKLLVPGADIISMKLSPKKDKVLYSRGNDQKTDLHIINIDGSGDQIVGLPEKIDMGSTGLTNQVISKGFVANALWFPDGSKLMVGFKYLNYIPLVGIYRFTDRSFTAIAPFPLYFSDQMIDDFRLFGIRVNTTGSVPVWQMNFFTLEDNSKLGIIRVVPQVSSFSFYRGDQEELVW